MRKRFRIWHILARGRDLCSGRAECRNEHIRSTVRPQSEAESVQLSSACHAAHYNVGASQPSPLTVDSRALLGKWAPAELTQAH